MQPQVIPQHVDGAREMIRQMLEAARQDAGENADALGAVSEAEADIEAGFDKLRDVVDIAR